jgi:hypothetical protein
MWAHEHMARERRFDKTTDRQALLPEFVRPCFLCGFGPGSSQRNWVRSLMACARMRPFYLYGNAARPGHLRDRKHAAFAEAVESAL